MLFAPVIDAVNVTNPFPTIPNGGGKFRGALPTGIPLVSIPKPGVICVELGATLTL